MKRLLCSITILLIIIILGLFKLGIALFEYKGKTSGNFNALVYSQPKETKYMKSYLVKINGKRFIVYIKKSVQEFEIGDIITFQGTYEKGETKRNYGGFDYNLYLKTKKIYGTFKVENAIKIRSKKSIIIILKKTISQIKEWIIKNFDKNLRDENSSLISGILIGETEEIPENTMENFKKASLTHVLAISGENFMYIVLILNEANKKIKIKNIGNILTIICIIFFMELTGNTASVIRAGTMGGLLIISKLLHRKYDFWTSLAFSLLIQIVNNPYAIFDIGLILSYSGVIGLVYLYKTVYNLIPSKIICGTIASNLAIIPITIYNFNTISIYFIISNILASILIEPITILGFVSIFFRFKFIYIILNFLLSIFNKTVQICAQIPLAQVYVTTPSLVSIMLYYLLLIMISKQQKEKMKSINKKIAITILIIFLFNINFEMLDIRVNKKLIINFVDVGQGDCTLIRTSNKSILIDSGGSTDSEYDVGKNIDLPYLLDRKIKKLDYIMISHFDADHCQGFKHILENIKVENAIICKQGKDSKLYQEFLKICKDQKIRIIYVKNNDSLLIGNIKLKILHPQDSLISNNPLNNNAIVCKLIYGNFVMLFTGDIEQEAEELLINKNIDIGATALKVGHHGSKTSSTEEFLKRVSPKIAIIGVGKNNKFGHPNEDVLKRLNDIGTLTYRTDKNGEITLKIEKNGRIKIYTMQ